MSSQATPDRDLPILSPIVRGSGASVVHRYLADNIAGYSLATYSRYWEYLPFLLPLAFRDRPARIVHTSPDHGIFFQRPGIPLVVTFHGFALDRFMQPYSSTLQRVHYACDLRLFTKLSLERADAVTAVSHFVADLVVEELGYRKPIQVIPNGVDTEAFCPATVQHTGQEVRVLFSGNLTRHKGADKLLEIARRLDPGIKIVYTTGPRGQGGIPDDPRLQPIGRVPHARMPACYQQADILLSPSVREGFGLAVAEAMACGLPVVATDGSALKELIEDGRGGFLCEIGDVEAFAARINQLAGNMMLRRRMGVFNRERVMRSFSLSSMIQAYQEVFMRVARAA